MMRRSFTSRKLRWRWDSASAADFLGLLHMEIVQERLEREFNIDLITTAPSVEFRITTTAGEVIQVDNPTKFPPPTSIQKIEEPILTAMIITSEESLGGVLKLCEEKRGVQKNFEYLSPTRVMLTYEMPLNEIVLDFYDRLKSVSRGYASLDYHLSGYRESDLVKLDVLVGGEPVDALTVICHREQAYDRGRDLVSRLRKLIPRQMFEVPMQAAIGSRIIARETISAIRKNVLAKCYGGDISRKRKLLEKQKEGKKRMKRVGTRGYPARGVPGGAESGGRRGRRLVLPARSHSCQSADQHAVSVAVEAIFRFDRVAIGAQDIFASGERRDHSQQARLRQMEIGKQLGSRREKVCPGRERFAPRLSPGRTRPAPFSAASSRARTTVVPTASIGTIFALGAFDGGGRGVGNFVGFGVDLVILDALGADGLEGSQADVERDLGDLDLPGSQAFQNRGREMQPGGRRGHGSSLLSRTRSGSARGRAARLRA